VKKKRKEIGEKERGGSKLPGEKTGKERNWGSHGGMKQAAKKSHLVDNEALKGG